MQRATLKEFGGLQTSVDRANCPPDKSPDATNIAPSLLRSMKARNGSAELTAVATRLPAAIDKLVRWHKKTGAAAGAYWIAAVGGTVYYSKDVSGVPMSRDEIESSLSGAVASAYWTHSAARHSGGAAIVSTERASGVPFYVPNATVLTAKVCGTTFDYKIDSGSWATGGTGPTWSIPATGAAHVITVRPSAVRNSKSLAVSGVANVVRSTTPAASSSIGFSVLLEGTRSAGEIEALYAGLPEIYAAYVWHYGTTFWLEWGWAGPTLATWELTSDTWLHVTFDAANGRISWHIDGETTEHDYGSFSATLDATSVLEFARAGASKTAPYYVDGYREDECLVDDFETTGGWTITGAGAAASSTKADSALAMVVDYFDHQTGAVFTALGSSPASGAKDWFFFGLDDNLYVTTDKSAQRSWDGSASAFTVVAASAYGAYGRRHGRRIFAGYFNDETDRMDYTDTDSATGWVDSVWPAGELAGQDCTGIATLRGRSHFFTQGQTYLIDGTDGVAATWVYTQMTPGVGCVAPRSIAETDNAVVFMSARGRIMAFGVVPGVMAEEGSDFMYLSRDIEDQLALIPASMLSKVVGHWYDGMYWLACAIPTTDDPNPTTNNTVFVCRPPDQELALPLAWYRFDYSAGGFHVTDFESRRGDDPGLFVGTEEGMVVQLDTGMVDCGAAIAVHYVIPGSWAPGGYTDLKHFKAGHLSARTSGPQTITVTPWTDTGDYPGAIAVNLSGDSDVDTQRIEVSAQGHGLELTFASQSENAQMEVIAFDIEFHNRGPH